MGRLTRELIGDTEDMTGVYVGEKFGEVFETIKFLDVHSRKILRGFNSSLTASCLPSATRGPQLENSLIPIERIPSHSRLCWRGAIGTSEYKILIVKLGLPWSPVCQPSPWMQEIALDNKAHL
jgi:hypothetical protein